MSIETLICKKVKLGYSFVEKTDTVTPKQAGSVSYLQFRITLEKLWLSEGRTFESKLTLNKDKLLKN